MITALCTVASLVREDQASAAIHVLGYDGHRAWMERNPIDLYKNGVRYKVWSVKAHLPVHKADAIKKAIIASCLQ